MTPKQIFESLDGKWSLLRSLGEHGIIHGTAIFDKSSNSSMLLYREDFLIKNFNQNTMQSYKEYEYYYDQGKIIKYFKPVNNKNLRFYELKFIENNFAIAVHICNLDRYEAEYRFYNLNNFKLKYYVKGPNKDYIIDTEFRKISPI